MTLFLLGPSSWRGRPSIPNPGWMKDLMTPSWSSRNVSYSPLDVRVALAETCKRAGHHAVVMEVYPRHPGERHLSLFNRIEKELKIRQHFVIWPPGCKRAGLDVEIGNLLTRLERGEELDVRVFSHLDAAGVQSGEFVSYEKGSRSRYYSDLYEHGALIIPWSSLEELFQFVVYAAGTNR